MTARTTFGQRLQALRLEAGMTQQQLADLSGLPLGSLRNYEQEQREPLWEVVFHLARAMGISTERFADCVAPLAKKPTGKKPAKKK